ncbi:MAG: hypothetical protein J0H79_15520 [Alphaproteobacteria bacterium]|nr:hypothetical protein [Alphaproteobacteria bacterium]
MAPTIMDWDDTPCPDCHRPHLCEGICSSEEFTNGSVVVCTSCGFAVSGRSREMVLAAVRVLARWKMV